jgi:xanthine permease XanP
MEVKLSLGNNKLLYSVDENPSFIVSLIQGFQHILLCFSGIVMVPIILGRTTNLSSSEVEYLMFAVLIISALTTLIQVFRIGKIGSGYLLFMGTSSSFIVCSIAAVNLQGLSLLSILCIFSAPFAFLFAYYLRFLRKLINPAVGGIIILLVSITLLPLAMNLWRGLPESPLYDSPQNFFVGAITIIIMLSLALFGNAKIRIWSPIIGIIAGYITAAFAGILEFNFFNSAPLWGIPKMYIPSFKIQFQPEIIPIFIAFIIATFLGAIETVGDSVAVQKISERFLKNINYERIQGSLYSDAIGNLLSGLVGTPPNTTYSGNISAIELTGVASKKIGFFGAGIMIIIAFFPKITGFILDIPGPVMGAALLVFIAILFLTGLNVIASYGLNYQTGLIVSLSLFAGIIAEFNLFFESLIPATFSSYFSNAIAVGGLTAIILTIIITFMPKKNISFALELKSDNLINLFEIINNNVNELNLTNKELYNLQLVSEELYMYILNNINEKIDILSFEFFREENAIISEIKFKGSIKEIDIIGSGKKFNPDQLEDLGLFVLSKIVNDFKYIYLSGFTYLTYSIQIELS